MDLIQKIRQFLANENVDYLLVNATNEFLAEYTELEENSRYFLTNFSGSTGDALISQENLFLFVDGRYHQQADLEVDKKNVSVVKMKMNQTFSECLSEKIEPNKTLVLVAKKTSQSRFEILKGLLEKKDIVVKLLMFDPITNVLEKAQKTPNTKIEHIDKKIVGLSADEKIELVSAEIDPNQSILTTSSEEISYICNLRDFSVNYSSKINGKLLIMNDLSVLFTNDSIEEFSPKIKVLKLDEFGDYIKNLANIYTFLGDKITINAYDYDILIKKAEFLNKNLIKEMKSIKTDAEIAHYKECFKRTDEAILATRNFIEANENLSEYDITKNLEENFYKFGAKSLSFKPIVAKDKNAALAHYTKNSKSEILKDGSLVLIDCGAYYEGGYATDCTRVFVKGQPTELQKNIYTIVLKGFLAAFNKNIIENTSGFALDRVARKILDEYAPEGFAFSHALGHGIGINVHESPPNLGLSPIAKTPLKPNMCFTIEPGLYKTDFGGVRLENTCYLEQNGAKLMIKSFSNMPFEKKLIDFAMLTKQEQKWLNEFEVI